MAVELITKEDLQTFKTELITELKKILTPTRSKPKEYLKSTEVKKMLGISSGTLQQLRSSKAIPYSKVGGIIFYKHQDIIKMLEPQKKTK